MPLTLTPEQKIQVVQAHGLDPSGWTASDDGKQLIGIKQPSLTSADQLPQSKDLQDTGTSNQSQQVDSQVQVAPQQDTPLQTGVKSAINVAPSMIGTGLGAAAVPALMEGAGLTLDTTGVGALLGIPLMLGGAYLGGKAVSSAQNAITPQSYKDDLARSQDANPKSAELGELATLPLGGFSPNPLNVIKGVGTAGKLISGLKAAPEEIANLGNVGIGGVIGGVQPLIQGDTSPSDILKNAAIGATFNTPNKIGQRLGFKPLQPRSLATSGQSPDVTQANTADLLTPNAQDKNTVDANTELNYNTPPHVNEVTGIPLDPAKELAKKIETLNQFGKTIMLPNDEKSIQPESTTDGAGRLTGEETDRLRQLEGIPNEALTEQEVEEMSQLYHKYDTVENKPVLTEAGKVLQDYANSPEFKAKFPNADVSQITPRFFNKWSTEISALHGITDTANPSLTTKGTAHIGQNTTEIGPKADAGTMAHENAHHIMDALPADAHKQLFDAVTSEYNKEEENRISKGKAPNWGKSTVEAGKDEYLATQLGYKAVTRLIRGPEDSNPLKQWWNDTKAQWKTKYGQTPTIADLYRANTYRLLNGISSIPKIMPNVTAPVISKENQSENEGLHQGGANEAYWKLWNSKEGQEHEASKTKGEEQVNPEVAKDWFGKMKEAVNKNQPEDEGINKKIASTPSQRDAIRSYLKDNIDSIAKEMDEKWSKANNLDKWNDQNQWNLKSTIGEYVSKNALDDHPMAGDLMLRFIKPFVSNEKFIRIKDVVETARKALGYDNMPFDENKAAKMAQDKRDAFYKNQPEQEGYIQKLEAKSEAKRAYVKERMAKLRKVRAFGGPNPDKEYQELQKINRQEHNKEFGVRAAGAMEGKPVGGRPLHTTLENRTPFNQEVTVDKTAPDGTVLKQGMLTTITKLVNKQINKVVALSSKNGKGIPFPKSTDRTDIVADVVKLMQQKGLDSDGLIPTISRRARTVMQERINEARKDLKTTSLDKPVGEGSTAHDKMAAQKLEEGAEGDDAEGVSKEDIEELDKHFNPSKENTIKQEAIPTEASAKPKQEALADDLLWHLEDNWDSIPESRLDAAKKTKAYLESQKGKTVDANEIAKMMRGEKNQEEGEGLQNPHPVGSSEWMKFQNDQGRKKDPLGYALSDLPVAKRQELYALQDKAMNLAEHVEYLVKDDPKKYVGVHSKIQTILNEKPKTIEEFRSKLERIIKSPSNELTEESHFNSLPKLPETSIYDKLTKPEEVEKIQKIAQNTLTDFTRMLLNKGHTVGLHEQEQLAHMLKRAVESEQGYKELQHYVGDLDAAKLKENFTPVAEFYRRSNIASGMDFRLRNSKANERNQETTEGISSIQKHNLLWLQSELDSSRKKAGEAGEPVAKVLAKLIPYRDQMFGRGTAKILQLVGKTNQADINKVHTLLMKSSIDKEDYRPLLTNNKQRDLWDSVRASLLQKQQDRIKAGEKITDWTPIREVNGVKTGGVKVQRNAQIDLFYYPSKFRANILNDIIERTGNYKQYENELAKHLAEHGAGPEEIKEKIMALRNAGDPSQPNATRFGASRIAQGMGLPVSLRDPDFAKTISYYFHKVSTDAAWHDLVEKDPKITNLLDEKNPDNMIHPFQGIINQIKGEPFDKDSKVMGAMNRVATSFMLGPLTNIHIAGSTIFNPFQFTRIHELPQVYNTMLKNIGSYTQHALDNGYLVPNTTNLKSITDGNSTFIERLQGITGLIGKINGRVMSDKISKVYAQAFGEAVLPLRLASANGGEAASQKLMLQLDPDWVKGKTYTPEQMTQLASVFGGFIHGAHDYRTLPELMTRDTIFKPFVSLMSWSVSQTNQWMKHVWEPATKGNLQPLIMSTLGAVAGGYLIQQMRQEVSNKKSNIPSLSEIYNSKRGLSGNAGLLAYNFAQMASFTGMVGIGSSLGKMGFDMAYKNIPQSATFPLDEYVHNFGTSIAEASSAFMQKPDAANFFRIFPQMMLDIGKENAQAARIALNWSAAKGVASETENYKYNISQADRDLRNYKMTEGLPYDQQVESLNNPYLNMEQKRFKRTTNVGEAASDIPEVLQTLIQRAKGNPDVLQSEMRSLKQNSYQTMPSPQNMPLQFAKYYQFLTKTYGSQIAQQRMQDYMQHEVANQIKTSLVPTF